MPRPSGGARYALRHDDFFWKRGRAATTQEQACPLANRSERASSQEVRKGRAPTGMMAAGCVM